MKSVQRGIAMIALLMLTAGSSWCQQFVQVTDKHSGLPVAGALVGAGNRQSVTDETGICPIPKLTAEPYHVHVTAIGYQPETMVLYRRSISDTLAMVLTPKPVTLDDIEVSGHRQAVSTSSSVSTMEQQSLRKQAGLDLAQTIRDLPGVHMMQTGATIAKPMIDGMQGNRILIVNQGVTLEGQQWGAEHAPEIDPAQSGSITVIQGAESVAYGAGAIGGVIVMEPPALPEDSSIHGAFHASGATNGRSGALSARLAGNLRAAPSWAWQIQGAVRRSGNYHAPDYYLSNTAMEAHSFGATAGYTRPHFDLRFFYSRFHTNLGIFKNSEVGNAENIRDLINHGRPYGDGSFDYAVGAPRQEVTHDFWKAQGHIHLNDLAHLNLIYGIQHDVREEYDQRRGGRSSLPSLDLSLWAQSLKLMLEVADGLHWKTTAGLEGSYRNNKNVPGTLTTPLIPDYIARGIGAFASGKYMRTAWSLDAGVRFDHNYISALGYDKHHNLYGSRRHFNTLSWSLGGIWTPTPAWTINTRIASAWRPPTVNELYSAGLHVGAGTLEFGDSSLTAEKSIKWVAGASYTSLSGRLRLSLDAYTQAFRGYIYAAPTGRIDTTLQGTFPVFESRQTNAWFGGANLTMHLRLLRPLSYQVQAGVIVAADVQHDAFLPAVPPARLDQRLRWEPGDLSRFTDNYIALSHVWVARQTRYTPGTDFAPPPPAYSLMGLQLGTAIAIGDHPVHVDIAVDNLWNVSYKEYLDRFRYFAHGMGRNITFRLAYSF